MEWVDGNLGSKLTMKYPSVYLRGEGHTARSSPLPLLGVGSTRTLAAKWCMPPHFLNYYLEIH
jgi:Fe-S cluster assembly protein SufB